MKKLLLCLFLFSGQALAEPPVGYPFGGYDEGFAAARDNGKKVFVYFGRFGCGFCDRTNLTSFSDNKVKQTYSDNYNLVFVDAEGGERLTLPTGEQITEMQLGERMNTLGTPVFFYMEPDGSEILKLVGYQSAANFRAVDAWIQTDSYKTQGLQAFLKGL